MLSPVTIRTVIPARWHFLMASGTCREKCCTESRGHSVDSSGACVQTRQTYLGPNRVLDADYSNASETGENVAFIIPVRLSLRGWEVPVGQADGPQPL